MSLIIDLVNAVYYSFNILLLFNIQYFLLIVNTDEFIQGGKNSAI